MSSETIRLADIAHARSGDKGDHANVAVIAYTEAGFRWLRQHLTAEAVAAFLVPRTPPRSERFEAGNVHALNFVLYNVLRGGASQSLRIDTQGKALATAVLQMPIPRPPDPEPMQRPRRDDPDVGEPRPV
jgi:hypothetical protein